MYLPLDEISSFFSEVPEHQVKNLFITAEGIFSAKTTNLNQVKNKLPTILENQETTQGSSNYKRLIRFFNLEKSEKEALTKLMFYSLFCLLGAKGRKPKYLALDGTSWELGDKDIHLITLCIIIKGVAIPIAWEDLDKKGTSNYSARKELLEKSLKSYNLRGMILLADREYIGQKWFSYLKREGLDFIIRVKKTDYKGLVNSCRGLKTKYFKHQKQYHSGMKIEANKLRYKNTGVSKEIKILGENYTFVVFKNPKEGTKDSLIYFVSTLKNKKRIVSIYPIRWKIECCFKHLKSNGFNLEDVNLKESGKIKFMMAIVCFLYALCIYQGLLTYKNRFFLKTSG